MVRKLSKSIVISGTSYTCHSTTSCCKVRMASLGKEGREGGQEGKKEGRKKGGEDIFLTNWGRIYPCKYIMGVIGMVPIVFRTNFL